MFIFYKTLILALRWCWGFLLSFKKTTLLTFSLYPQKSCLDSLRFALSAARPLPFMASIKKGQLPFILINRNKILFF